MPYGPAIVVPMEIVPGLRPGAAITAAAHAPYSSARQVATTFAMQEFVRRMHGAAYQCECAANGLSVPPPTGKSVQEGFRDTRYDLKLGEIWPGPVVTGHPLTFLIYVNSKSEIRREAVRERESCVPSRIKASLEHVLSMEERRLLVPIKELNQRIGIAIHLLGQRGLTASKDQLREGLEIARVEERTPGAFYLQIPVPKVLVEKLSPRHAAELKECLTFFIRRKAVQAALERHEQSQDDYAAFTRRFASYHEQMAREYDLIAEGAYPIVQDRPTTYLISSSGDLLAIELCGGHCMFAKSDVGETVFGKIGYEQAICFNGHLVTTVPRTINGVNPFRDFQFMNPERLSAVPSLEFEEGALVIVNASRAMQQAFRRERSMDEVLAELENSPFTRAMRSLGIDPDSREADGRTDEIIAEVRRMEEAGLLPKRTDHLAPQPGARLRLSYPHIRVPDASEVGLLRLSFEQLVLGVNECYALTQGRDTTPLQLRADWSTNGVRALSAAYERSGKSDDRWRDLHNRFEF